MAIGQASSGDPEPRGALRPVLIAAAIVAIALFAAVIVALLFRNALASFLVETYLANHGVKSRVAVSQLGFGGAAAEATLGDASEFSAQRIEVRYDDFPFATRVRAIRILRPVVRVGFDGSRFSLGSLQSFVDEQSRQKRNGPMPEISIENAKVLLQTPGGAITIAARGEWQGANAATFQALAYPGALRFRNFSADLTSGFVDVHPAGGALVGGVTLAGSAFSGDAWRVDHGRISFALHGLTLGGLVQNVGAHDGQAEFLAEHAALERVALDGIAAKVTLAGLEGGYTNSVLRGNVSLQAAGTAEQAAIFESKISNLAANLALSAKASDDGSIDISGKLASRASMDPNSAGDLARRVPLEDAALRTGLANALRSVKLDMPAWDIVRSGSLTALVLGKPASLGGANGAVLTVTGGTAKPVAAIVSGKVIGAVAIGLRGPSLPSGTLQISYGGGDARDIRADWNGGVTIDWLGARGLTLHGRGQAAVSPQQFSVVLDSCGRFALARYVSSGRETIARAAGTICQNGSNPLVASDSKGWTVLAAWRDVSTALPTATARLEHSAGQIALKGSADGSATGTLDVRSARLVDASPQPRFNPLDATGHFVLADQAWRGSLAITAGTARRPLGTVQILHSLKDGHGSADIVARNLAFAPDGLQPTALSPLLIALQRATGAAKFSGRVNWTARGITSEGQLDIEKLEFLSPLGHATEAGTHVHFTSLLPPRTADNQPVTVALVDWLTPLSNSSASITWNGTALHVEQTKTNAAHGTLSVAPVTISFAPGGTTQGEVRLDQIDLATLVAASNLSDRMSVEGKIEGDIPLTFGPEGLRFINGTIHLMGPGRLSINRSVWGGSGATVEANDAMRDLAYQALEHLAVDAMDGKLNSLDNGRLGLVLHIKGRNDPSNATDTRVGVFDLLRGQAFSKPLALPKGTPIDLTLDLSLNFDQLLAAYRGAWANAASSAITSK